MTSTIDNVTKVTELISKLTVEDAIGSDQTNLVLKAIKRIGCFTDSQFSAFAKTCAVEQKPLVHQLRAQAKAALVAVAGGEAKLELTDIAQKAKVEQLILAVCKEDRHLVSDIPTDEKIDVLTHAKRILPQDRSTYAKAFAFKIILNIPIVDREKALEGLPHLLSTCTLKVDQQEVLFRISEFLRCGPKNGVLLQEVVPLLARLPYSAWEIVLDKSKEPFGWLASIKRSLIVVSTYKLTDRWQIAEVVQTISKEGYSDTLMQNALPLLQFSQKQFTYSSILKNLAAIQEKDQASVVASCLALLRPLSEPWIALDHSFEVAQSPFAKRCLELVSIMQPGTPWSVLADLSRLFSKPKKTTDDELQQKIAELIKTYRGNQLQDALHGLQLDNAMRYVFNDKWK